MKVSIITVSYNSSDTIRKTFNSVKNQNYDDIELIVVDGGSNDSTVSIINENKNFIAKFICEPDNGIYDAMNKGIKLASGDIIGILILRHPTAPDRAADQTRPLLAPPRVRHPVPKVAASNLARHRPKNRGVAQPHRKGGQ